MAINGMALGAVTVCSLLSVSTAFAPSFSPLLRSTQGRSPALNVNSPRTSPKTSVSMGFFDGLTKAFEPTPAGGASLDSYQGWIERDGMRRFSFDGIAPAALPTVGQCSMAGRNAGSAPPPQQNSGGLFGFLSPSQPANAPPPKENQDGTLALPDVYDGIGMYCVFDGHGEYGGQVTQWCIQNLPAYVSGALAEGRPGQLLNRITDAYRSADAALVEAIGYRVAEDSGSTVATAVLKGDLLLVAGLGDSRVVLGTNNGDGTLGAQPVTLDQSPVVAAEKARIEASGGEVRNEGPGGRVYAKGQEYPGLAVSRAFGDADAKQYGVTSDPQFIGWKIRPGQDFALILASDGVWNALSNEVVVDIAAKYAANRNADGAAKEIVGVARQTWESIAKGRIDDISAVVVYL